MLKMFNSSSIKIEHTSFSLSQTRVTCGFTLSRMKRLVVNKLVDGNTKVIGIIPFV